MPPLRFCGVPWHCASDDLVLPYALSAVFSSAMGAAAACVASDEDGVAPAPFAALAAVLWATVLVDCCVAAVARRGSVFDARARALLYPLLYVRILGEVCRTSALIVLTVAVAAEGGTKAFPTIIIVVQWVAVFHMLLVGCSTCSRYEDVLFRPFRMVLRLLGRCAGLKPDHEYMRFVVDLLESYLGNVEVTMSDALAGLALVARVQSAVRNDPDSLPPVAMQLLGVKWSEEDHRALDQSRGGALPGTKAIPSRLLVEELFHNLCFAIAVYGWALHLYSGHGSMFKNGELQKRSPLRVNDQSMDHQLNVRAALTTLAGWPGHAKSTLVYFQHRSSVGDAAYAIFVDPPNRHVVVAVRGTQTFSDAITDVCAEQVEVFDEAVTGPASNGPHYVHRGMWESALNLRDRLEESGLLRKLLVEDDRPGVARLTRGDSKLEELPDCRGYTLLTVGHSLGAGIAQLLAALLRKEHPEWRCTSQGYGAPAVCSAAFAQHLRPHGLAAVAGDDVIARLTVRGMEVLRDRLVTLLAHCPMHKSLLLLQGSCLCWRARHTQPLLLPSVVCPEAQRAVEKLDKKQASPPFYHAGRICYLRVLRTDMRCCGLNAKDTEFHAEWADSEQLQEILVSRRMMVQHFPDHYRSALQVVLNTWLDEEKTDLEAPSESGDPSQSGLGTGGDGGTVAASSAELGVPSALEPEVVALTIEACAKGQVPADVLLSVSSRTTEEDVAVETVMDAAVPTGRRCCCP